MISQSRATVLGKIEMVIVAMLCSGSYVVAEYVSTLLGAEYQLNIFALPAWLMAAYLGLFVVTSTMMYLSLLFIGAAILNNTRRTEMLDQLTNALDLVIENKQGASILFPTINFLDA